MSQTAARILVVKLDHIGDFALALPALRGLKTMLPETLIDVVVSPVNRGWRDVVPWLNEFLTVQFPAYQTGREQKCGKSRLVMELLLLAWRLRQNSYTAAIDLRMVVGDWRGKLVTRLAGASRRLGGSGAGTAFLTEICEEQAKHQASRIAERLARLAPALRPTLGDCVSVRRGSPTTESARVLFHPGAGNAAKRWPVEHWCELVRQAQAAGGKLSLRIIGSAADEALVREICRLTGLPAGAQAISSSLRETLEWIADADLLVGLDSAAPHLAALVGTPAITIFSAANDPERWKALGDNTVLFTSIECSPCEQATCRWPTHRCMEQITPPTVFAAIQANLHMLRLSP